MSPPAGALYVAGDYLSQVRAIWQASAGGFYQVRFPNALVLTWKLSGTDKQEGKISIEIEAVLDMTVTGNTTATSPVVHEFYPTGPA